MMLIIHPCLLQNMAWSVTNHKKAYKNPLMLKMVLFAMFIHDRNGNGGRLVKLFEPYEWNLYDSIRLPRSMPNADQCQLMSIKIMALNKNASQCRSIPINLGGGLN